MANQIHAVSTVLDAYLAQALNHALNNAPHQVQNLLLQVLPSPRLQQFLPIPNPLTFVLPNWRRVTRNGKRWNVNLNQTCFLGPMERPPFMIELDANGNFVRWVYFDEDRSHLIAADLITIIGIHNRNLS